jgi:hypothetical protein
MEPNNDEPENYFCDVCEKTYKTAIGLQSHICKLKPKARIACPFCPSRFTRNASLTKHLKDACKNKPSASSNEIKVVVNEEQVNQFDEKEDNVVVNEEHVNQFDEEEDNVVVDNEEHVNQFDEKEDNVVVNEEHVNQFDEEEDNVVVDNEEHVNQFDDEEDNVVDDSDAHFENLANIYKELEIKRKTEKSGDGTDLEKDNVVVVNEEQIMSSSMKKKNSPQTGHFLRTRWNLLNG